MSKLDQNGYVKIVSGMSRRDALKMMGLSPIAAGVLASSSAPVEAKASDAKGKIVIVGGGAGGIMAMARLRRALSEPDITIIAPNEVHLYQPGQVFMAAGEYTHEDIVGSNLDLIPDDVKWIKDEVARFEPDNNRVVTRGGESVTYDFLVVATGLVYHYEQIEGLSIDMIGKNGISSVYLNDLEKGTAEGGTITWKWFNDLKQAAQKGKPRVICTQPATPIKCGGAPQKILYLADDFLKREGLDADFVFALNGDKLFGVPEVNETLAKVVQPRYGNITNKFTHNLVAIDAEKKIATFETKKYTQGAYDEDLEEYEMIEEIVRVPMQYDFIHIVPPMSAPKAVVESPLAWQQGSAQGWLEVDRETLQHTRYPNVFGIGDVCGIPLGKTGGSARHHGPIMVANLIAQMEKKELTQKFDGYTVCPLKTQYGKIILAEFNYEGAAPSFPLAVGEERWIWWAFDLYMLKPMYWHLMMRGLM
ncbi:NAD(P)/FAD-dependent oxidoreductase [Sulfuricurvum sp. IAE1]|jgi:sulfide:quinone oxidoreductase|uniref:NAD(P)/FAD-dependent oxidoreductase n=1 Tax=Sulfuricurvum sp. IAE1 TaxID=2546102 RepID=UPI001049CAAB|nr:FAD/NAD(P)-binding oxidoreductase [Sulfuricurvum sp. IAE1]MDX9966968.1 FAD/NAD(P)-binding oxidoreductase [Sulfuricurvum sp.]TDA64157.1 NAD(P)/FAD-dependent oxidoreductase [Sulfuricurvum sp. IAE1]